MDMVVLEDVADEVTVGFVGSMADEYIDQGVPFLRSLNVLPLRIETDQVKYVSREFHEKLKKSALKPGDVVIVRTGKPGTCAVIPDDLEEANCSDLVIVRCGPKIRPRFLAYWVNTIASEHVASHLVGAVQQHFNVGAAKQMPVRLPSLDTQDDILSILGALDDKIEVNRKTAATLEEMARALYRSWFVDFDPVHAKAAGRSPAHMDPATAALFPDSFGEDGLPEGWEMSTLGEELIILDSKRIPLSKSQRSQRTGSIPYYGATSIMDYVDEPLFDEVLLLVGEDGSVVKPDGKPFTQYIWGKAWVNNHAHVLKGRRFSVEQLKCIFDDTAISAFVTGAVQLKLNQGNMKKIPFVSAGDHVHAAFDEMIRCWFEQIRFLSEQNQTLATLRDTLLPRLMSGELRVGAAREQVEEVV